jgi:RNA polymerase sigma-54 factor
MSMLKLTQSLKQQLVLTPQLRQRIEMLQMTNIELSELIQQELINNPVLEEVQDENEVPESTNGYEEDQQLNLSPDNEESVKGDEPEDQYLDGEAYEYSTETEFVPHEYADVDNDFKDEVDSTQTQAVDPFEEVDFGQAFQDYLDPGYKTQPIEVRDDLPQFDQFLTNPPKLAEHLEWQLNLLALPADLKEAAIAIIGNLDEDGRLADTIEEICSICELPAEIVEKARQIVMQLDPVGCGALNVQECLIAQLLQSDNKDPLTIKLIEKHFPDLQPSKLLNLSKQLGVSLEKLKEQIEIIRKLDPFPGRKYSASDPVYVTPEIYIEKVDDDYVIYFADDTTFRLRINTYYQQILQRDDTPKETKDFIKEKLRSAIDLLRNIEHRRQTIYRVVECIVRRQREFLDKGVEFLKPMMMKEIAEEIGLHPSTISRVVNRKYAYTPQGIIELRRFFTEGMMNEDGEEVSTRIIKLKIKKMISEENPHEPLTDEQIAKLLQKDGIKISRRTVAKYREQMKIPGSRERKSVI